MEMLRLVMLVDLPDATRRDRKEKRQFQKLIYKCGFAELQSGVFTKVVNGRDSANAYERKLHEHCPETGLVRLLVITERQFQNSKIIAGEEQPQESEIGSDLDIFL